MALLECVACNRDHGLKRERGGHSAELYRENGQLLPCVADCHCCVVDHPVLGLLVVLGQEWAIVLFCEEIDDRLRTTSHKRGEWFILGFHRPHPAFQRL